VRLGLAGGDLLDLVRHRASGPREPAVLDHSRPQAHRIHHLRAALPDLAVERPLHHHRPRHRVVRRLAPAHPGAARSPDHDARLIDVEGLQHRLVPGSLSIRAAASPMATSAAA
jgi:hypothetical protein